jgi:hypothetical protein
MNKIEQENFDKFEYKNTFVNSDSIMDTLNEWGQEGWEAIDLYRVGQFGRSTVVTFKRKIKNGKR